MRLKTTLLIAFSVVAAVASLAWLTIRNDTARNAQLLHTVTALSTQTIHQVTITPDPMSRKPYHVVVTAQDDLREISELLRRADIKDVGSHNEVQLISGPLGCLVC